jgi:hypothetical protein
MREEEHRETEVREGNIREIYKCGRRTKEDNLKRNKVGGKEQGSEKKRREREREEEHIRDRKLES